MGEFLQTVLSICGAVSILGGAGAVIVKVIRPAFKISKRVEMLEEYNQKDYKRLQSLEEMQKQQSKCLAAMLNHQITGNGIEPMKKIRDELLESRRTINACSRWKKCKSSSQSVWRQCSITRSQETALSR